jgi:hypothetical protein
LLAPPFLPTQLLLAKLRRMVILYIM